LRKTLRRKEMEFQKARAMRVLLILIVFILLIPFDGWGQTKKQTKRYIIRVTTNLVSETKQGLIIHDNVYVDKKGYLADLSVTSIHIIGKRIKMEAYNRIPVERIQEIRVRREGQVGTGAVIGLGVGALMTGIIASQDNGGYGTGAMILFGIPTLTILGALIGTNSKEKFQIDGDLEKYHQIKPKLEKFLIQPHSTLEDKPVTKR